MSKFSRRDFLKFTSSLLAFVPAIRNLSAGENRLSSAEEQQPAPPPPTPQLTDEDLIAAKYESGTAKTINSNHIIIENYKGQVNLFITDQTDIWDGIKWVGDLGSEAGDRIVAWGIRNSDGSLTCEKLYVNIVNYIGEVSQIKAKNERDEVVAEFIQNDRFRGHQPISVSPSTIIDDGNTPRTLFREKPLLPKDQEVIQVIGRTMKDGTTLAVIVYLS